MFIVADLVSLSKKLTKILINKHTKCVLSENKAFQLDIYILEATWTSNFRVYRFHSNTKL